MLARIVPHALLQFVGSWGVAAYQRAADRARAEGMARKQCSKAYPIAMGPSGGVMMHLPDEGTAQEMRIKTSP